MHTILLLDLAKHSLQLNIHKLILVFLSTAVTLLHPIRYNKICIKIWVFLCDNNKHLQNILTVKQTYDIPVILTCGTLQTSYCIISMYPYSIYMHFIGWYSSKFCLTCIFKTQGFILLRDTLVLNRIIHWRYWNAYLYPYFQGTQHLNHQTAK